MPSGFHDLPLPPAALQRWALSVVCEQLEAMAASERFTEVIGDDRVFLLRLAIESVIYRAVTQDLKSNRRDLIRAISYLLTLQLAGQAAEHGHDLTQRVRPLQA